MFLWLVLLALAGCDSQKKLECDSAARAETALAATGFFFSVEQINDVRGPRWSVTWTDSLPMRASTSRRDALRAYSEAADSCLVDSLVMNDEATRVLVAKRSIVRLLLTPPRGLPAGI